jgi:hypothetical protein
MLTSSARSSAGGAASSSHRGSSSGGMPAEHSGRSTPPFPQGPSPRVSRLADACHDHLTLLTGHAVRDTPDFIDLLADLRSSWQLWMAHADMSGRWAVAWRVPRCREAPWEEGWRPPLLPTSGPLPAKDPRQVLPPADPGALHVHPPWHGHASSASCSLAAVGVGGCAALIAHSPDCWCRCRQRLALYHLHCHMGLLALPTMLAGLLKLWRAQWMAGMLRWHSCWTEAKCWRRWPCPALRTAWHSAMSDGLRPWRQASSKCAGMCMLACACPPGQCRQQCPVAGGSGRGCPAITALAEDGRSMLSRCCLYT